MPIANHSRGRGDGQRYLAKKIPFDMTPFRQFVQSNARWFRGHLPETNASLDTAEESLGVRLPEDVRWLLCEYGYWHATGISSLDEVVTRTQVAREHLHLPKRFVVLYDHHDGGVIVLDTVGDSETGQNKVYDIGWESVPNGIDNEIAYDSVLEYVQEVLDRQRDFLAPEDIDYDPARYRSV